MNDSQALASTVSYLLDNATQESTWGDYQRDWDPIITTLTCKLLLSCGLSAKTFWYINRNGYSSCTLNSTFAWLNNSISPDGRFGTDFWDAAQLGILIEVYSLHSYFSAYETLKNRLLDAIQKNELPSDPSQWQGPGFYASAIAYLRLLGERDHAARLERNLAGSHQDGCWQGQAGPGGIPFAVWHTAQCVLALSEIPESHPEALAKGVSWLVKMQHESGAWESIQQYNVYFTAYAVLALLHDRLKYAKEIQRGLDYLRGQIASDGKCSDLGGTLMCALALRSVVGDNFERDLSLVDYLLARKNVSRAEISESIFKTQESELSRVKAELARYQAKYNDAEFVITKPMMFVLALVGILISLLGNLGSGVINAWVEHRHSAPPQYSSPDAPETERAPSDVDSSQPSDLPNLHKQNTPTVRRKTPPASNSSKPGVINGH